MKNIDFVLISHAADLRSFLFCNIHKRSLYNIRFPDVPSPPVLVEIHNIGPHSAMLSWSEGFHGGSDQTVYYEISSDNTTWTTVPMDAIGTSETQIIRNTTVSNLKEATVYYIRLYSINSLGRSEMSDISNLTTTGNAFTDQTSSIYQHRNHI